MPASDLPELPRRARGTGSIVRVGNKFRASIRLPDDSGEVKPRRKNVETYEAAEQWLDSIIKQQRRVLHATGSGTKSAETVVDLMRLWIMSKYRDAQTLGKPDIKTVHDYDAAIRDYIVPHLGEVHLSKLGAHHIETWQDAISEVVSKRTGKKLSPDRKRILWITMKQSMGWGYMRGYLRNNPCAGLKGFKKKTVDVRRKAMQPADYRKFMNYLTANACDHTAGYCRLRWLIGIQLGRRQNEVLGLCWTDVDYKAKTIRIDNRLKQRTWKHGCEQDEQGNPTCGKKLGAFCPQRHGGGVVLLEGTKSGTQSLLPINNLVKYFREHEKAQTAERAAFKKRTGQPAVSSKKDADGNLPPNYVFTQPDSQKLYGATSDNLRFKRTLAAAGITTYYHVHQLRHSAASQLASSTDGNIPVIRDVLGHKTVLTSMLYISDDMKARQKALTKVWNDAMKVDDDDDDDEDQEELTKEA